MLSSAVAKGAERMIHLCVQSRKAKVLGFELGDARILQGMPSELFRKSSILPLHEDAGTIRPDLDAQRKAKEKLHSRPKRHVQVI
jgi:hypothetical protein